MRALVVALALGAAVTWGRAADAASVVVDVVADHIALDVGDRDVWGIWLRSTTDVEVASLEIALVTTAFDSYESIEFDVLNHYLGPDYPSPGLVYLLAYDFPLAPSVRIATLTRPPLEFPPHVISVPGLVPMEHTIFPYTSISTSGSPLSTLSLTQDTYPYCGGGPCEIPVAPTTATRWLWVLPEPHAATLLAAALALLALRRRA